MSKKDDKNLLTVGKNSNGVDKATESAQAGFNEKSNNLLMRTVNTQYGERSIFVATDISSKSVIPTMSQTLNWASGIGGIAQGYIHEIFGPSGAGKTAISLGIIANAQMRDLVCLFVDAENRFDMSRANQLGVDCKKLLISNNNIIEQVFDLIHTVIMTGKVQLVILDSLATLMSEKEYDSDMDANDMGKKAQLIGKGIKKINGAITNIKQEHPDWVVPTVILTNQIRMSTSGFGNPEIVPGGQAPKFFCSQRIRIQPKIYLDDKGKEISMGIVEPENKLIGVKIAHKHVKNTFAPPHRCGSYTLYWDSRGIDNIEEVLMIGLVEGVITQAGAFYAYKGNKYQGKANLVKYFKETKEAYISLLDDLKLPMLKDVGESSPSPVMDLDAEGASLDDY